jgi:DNA-binding MarR family transcriptional regulator
MLLAAASLALALACARIVEEQSVTLSIGDDLSCHATVALNKSIEDEESMIIGIQYILPAGITDLRVYDTSGRLEHRQTQRDSDILFHIPFSEPLKTGGSRTVYIEYDKADCVRRADDSFELSARFSLLSPTSLFRITVILPEGYVLPVELNREPSQLRPVISPNAVIRTDGRKLEFEWSLRDLSPEDPLWFFVRFNPIARGASPYWALLAAVAVAAAFRLGQHLPLAHREPRAFGFVLREDERRVTDALLSAGGELKQNDLAREVGYSKAKVSYLVRDLEKRGVVKKSPLGRTNRIRLLVRKEELA